MLCIKTYNFLAIGSVLASILGSSADLIVDNDSDLDDLGAMMYLLATAGDNLRAIVVDANGWSNQWAGVVNNQRVLQQFNCNDVDIAYGKVAGYTNLGNIANGSGFDGSHYPDEPPQQYLVGLDTVFSSGCTGFEWPLIPTPPYPFGDRQLMLTAILSDPKPTDLLILGPFTNVATLFMDNPAIMEEIGVITISGGYGARHNTTYHVNDLPEGATTSTTDEYEAMYSSIPEDGGQNVLLDANSASYFFGAIARCQKALAVPEDEQQEGHWYPKSCPTVQIMSGPGTEQIRFTTASEDESLCGPGTGCDTTMLGRDIREYYEKMPDCLDESINDIFYWDQSAAVMSQGLGDTFCTKWETVKFSVSVVDGPFFSTVLLDDEDGAEVTVCWDINRTAFLIEYWKPFRELTPSDENKSFCEGRIPLPLMPIDSVEMMSKDSSASTGLFEGLFMISNLFATFVGIVFTI